jgi:UDP-N-acetylglucosamine 2-epimerase (non-hydrolysing)
MSPLESNPVSVACIVGARPNFMKIAPIMEQLAKNPRFRAKLIHTGQHFSPEMSDAFFRDLGMPKPDEYLGVAPGSQTEQTASMMRALEALFLQSRPDLVLVVGDVTSTLAASLVAAKLEIPLAHVEAGLRSFDRRMPEEINRMVTDTLADYLFVSEPSGLRNLRAEGVAEDRIFFVGNVMIDSLLRFRDHAMQSDILDRLQVSPKGYALVTLHRPSNVDDPAQLSRLAGLLNYVGQKLPVVFPIHPRTRQRLADAHIATEGLILSPPLGYLDFLRLMAESRFVLTDSGGIQEETTVLGVPCLTLRENTERPVTLEQGTNRLVGADPQAAQAAVEEVLSKDFPPGRIPELWDGKASVRIVETLSRQLA